MANITWNLRKLQNLMDRLVALAVLLTKIIHDEQINSYRAYSGDYENIHKNSLVLFEYLEHLFPNIRAYLMALKGLIKINKEVKLGIDKYKEEFSLDLHPDYECPFHPLGQRLVMEWNELAIKEGKEHKIIEMLSESFKRTFLYLDLVRNPKKAESIFADEASRRKYFHYFQKFARVLEEIYKLLRRDELLEAEVEIIFEEINDICSKYSYTPTDKEHLEIILEKLERAYEEL